MSRKQCRRKVWGLVNPIQHAIDRAQAGLSDAHDRFKATGRMGLSGPAIQAMRDLAEYHDLQRSSISRGEYERWIVKTRNQIRGAVANRRMAVATP